LLVLAMAWLLAACASSPEEGVVKERGGDDPPMTSTAAHFPRPSYAPGTQGVSSGHEF